MGVKVLLTNKHQWSMLVCWRSKIFLTGLYQHPCLLAINKQAEMSNHSWHQLRDDFKTQPSVDRRFHPGPAGFYCSKQWQPPRTGQNCWSTSCWVLQSTLTKIYLNFKTTQMHFSNHSNTHATVKYTVTFTVNLYV